jgi:hypothetical protein
LNYVLASAPLKNQKEKMKFNLGMFLVITGVAFIVGTGLRFLYAMYQRWGCTR